MENRPPDGGLDRTIRFSQFLLLVIGLIAIFLILAQLWNVFALYDTANTWLYSTLGLPGYLSKGLAAIGLMVGLVAQGSIAALIFFGRKSKVGLAWAGGLVAIYLVGGFLFQPRFDQETGQAVRYYSIGLDGKIVDADQPGFDQVTGRQREPFTPEVARIAEMQRKGQFPVRVQEENWQDLQFFDPHTGRPKVYYFLSDQDKLELWTDMGVHPKYAQPLRPVTPDIVRDIEAKRAENELQARETERAAAEKERNEAKLRSEQAEQLAARKQREKREAQRQASVRKARAELGVVSMVPARSVFLVAGAETVSATMTKSLTAWAARQDGDLYRIGASASRTAAFRQLLSGDRSVLKRADLNTTVVGAVVVRVTTSCIESEVLPGAMSCEAIGELEAASKQGSVRHSESAREVGTSRAEGVSRALAAVEGKLAAALAQ